MLARTTIATLAAASLLAGGAAPTAAQETGDADADTPPPAEAAPGVAPGVPAGTEFPVEPSEVRRPEVPAVRTSGEIEVDGRLDEETWREAHRITGFVQSMPSTGSPATEETVVRVLYDDENVYVGAVMYDEHPERITVHSLEREFETHDSDVFAVTFDPFLDRRNSFMFLINPVGAIKDGQTFDNSRITNLSWDGILERAARVHDRGWTAEMAIPLKTLRFETGEAPQDWGIQFLRRIRRKAEDVYWAPVDRRTRVHKMAEAGTLRGLEEMEQAGGNLKVKPYVLSAASGASVGEGGGSGTGGELDTATEFEVGGDVKYGITPRLTLDLTYNTDFSQVEVDRERVNLTRFSLFFPERREFFVENSGIFAFGDQTERNYRLGASPRDFTLFHSRRVGLDEEGQPVPILGGGRLTGRVGGTEVGLLNMQTEVEPGTPAENFSAVRLRRTFFDALQVGGLVLNRQATSDPLSGGTGDPGDDWNRSYGVDANLNLFENLIVHSYLAGSSDPAAGGGSETAGRVSAAWRDAFWDISAMYRQMGDDFQPEMGFVRRRDLRHAYGTVGVHPRPSWDLVVAANPYVELHRMTNLESVLETRTGTAGLDVDFIDGSQLQLSVSDRYERLFEPFDLGEATVPVGEYDFTEGSLQYQSSSGRDLSGRVRLATGGYFGGSRSTVEGTALWRPSPHFALDLTAQHNVLEAGGEEFTADVFGGRLKLAGSTRLFGSAYVQYNEATNQLVSNLRVNFIHAPLSDVFLVYRERRDVSDGTTLDRRLTAKVTRLFAF